MKTKNNVLLSVDESDLKDGKFENKTITEIADGCFNEMESLVSVNLPKVKKIGSYCFRYNATLTSISLPALTTAGSDCFSSNNTLTSISLPALTTAGSECFRYNNTLTSIKIKGKKLIGKNVDGDYFVIESEKSTKGIKIYTGYNFVSLEKKVIKKQECFVAEKDNFYAHGETVKQAISDLQFKVVAEKLKHDPIKPETIITKEYYHIVTGSCNLGIDSWVKQNNLSDKQEIRADELFKILKKTNAYGFERFKQLVTF